MSPIAVVLAAALALVPARQESKLEFQVYGSAFLRKHGLEETTTQPLAEISAGPPYARFVAGVYDLRIAGVFLKDKTYAERYERAVLAVLDLQRVWCEWAALEPGEAEMIAEDFETVGKWVKSWRGRQLASANDGGDLGQLLKPKDPVVEASARLRECMTSGRAMGLELERDDLAVVIFAPNRESFLELAAFAGWIDPKVRPQLWQDGMIDWTRIWSGETQIVALEYAAWPTDHGQPFNGQPMDARKKTGLEQEVIEQAAQALFFHYFGTSDALFFETAAATNLVIASCGENDVQTDSMTFKNVGASTQPYTRFVPGGNPAGGILPARMAIALEEVPLWRITVGKDHYVKPLQRSQKSGAKQAVKDVGRGIDKRAWFQITAREGALREVVGAPFLGVHAEGKQLPEDDLLNDYEDFFRCYKACLFNWLQTEAVGKESEATFARLIHALAAREAGTSFDALVEEVYGAPLSGADGETDSLEWRFLAWLAK